MPMLSNLLQISAVSEVLNLILNVNYLKFQFVYVCVCVSGVNFKITFCNSFPSSLCKNFLLYNEGKTLSE